MVKKSNFIKNLLTTASAVAVLAGGVQDVMAVDRVTLTNNAALGTAANWQAGGGVAAPVAGAGNMIFLGGAHNLAFNNAIGNLGILNLAGNNTTVTVTTANELAGIISDSATYVARSTAANNAAAIPVVNAPAAKANFVIDNNGVQTFNAVNNLGTIQFTHAAGKAIFNQGGITIDAASTIDGKGGNNGVVEVNAVDLTFDNLIGGTNRIASFKLNNGKSATLKKAIVANGNIELGNASTLTIGAGANVTAADVTATNAGDGTVVFKGASTVTAKIGNANAVDKLIIGAGTVELQGGVTKTVNGIELSNAGSVLKLSTADQAITADIKNTSGTDGKGKIQLATAHTFTIKGNVGAAGAQLEAINFDGAADLVFEKAALDLYVKDITVVPNAATNVKFKADTVNIYGNIGTATNKVTTVKILESVAGGTNIATVNLKGGKIYATDFDMANNAATNNILALEDNSEVHANITTANVNNGTIVVKGNATIDGQIGTNNAGAAAAINKILFDTAEKTLTVTKNSITTGGANNGIYFTADGTLDLTEVANLNLANAPLIIAADAAGKGTIKVNGADNGKTVTIAGNIGDYTTVDAATKALKLLEVKGGADIVLMGNAYIKKIDIGARDAKLSLSEGGAHTYKISEFAHENGKGTVEFREATTLKAGTVLSKADNRLKEIQLTGDHNITFEDGLNLYTTDAGGIKNNAVGQGTLIFEGDSIVDAYVGKNNAFKAIQVKGDGKSVNFKQDINLTKNFGAGTITISNGATAIFEGNVIGLSIDGAADSAGTINFANKGAKEIDLVIGQGHALNTVTLSGAEVTFKQITSATNFNFNGANVTFNKGVVATNLNFSSGDVKFENDATAANLNFTGTKAVKATFVVDNTAAANNDSKLNGANITTTANRMYAIQLVLKDAANAGRVEFKANKDIGTEDISFGNFIIDDKMTVKVNTTNFFAGVITETKGKGKVEFVKNGATTLNLGDKNKNLESVTFTNSATVREILNADTVIVAAGQTATLKDKFIFISANGMSLEDGATALFTGEVDIEGNIAGEAAGKGTVIFNGSAFISKALGDTALEAITFSSDNKDNVASISADLTATNITVKGLTFNVAEATTLTGASSFTDTTFDLHNNENVTLTGGESTISGDIIINAKLNTADQATLGGIIVDGANSKLDASGLTGLEITVDDKNVDLPGATPKTYTLFSKTNGANITGFSQDELPANGTNTLATWTFNPSTGVVTRINDAANKLKAIVGTSNANLFADAGRMGDANNIGDARAVQSDLGKMTQAEVKDALQRLSNPIVTAADAVGGAISGASQMTQNRIGELSPHPTAGIQTSDAGISGVSAGDDSSKYGAWVSPFYNVANQSAKSGAAGYKSTSYGASIGVDTMTNADMSLGVALSYLKTDIKHKNIKAGDKTKADTYMFSIYGIQQLTNDWFLQGVAMFSSSKIKNKEKRGTSTGYQIAKGEYDATSYGAELLAGYMYNAGDVKVTPLGGFAVSRFNDGGYKETGTTSQNLTITKKAATKLEGILGARVEMANMYAAEGMELTPELHGYVRHNFLNQNGKVTTKMDGLNQQFAPKSSKANKTMFNLGASLNSKSGMYEYGAGYDLNLSSKYVGHQGTVKVRVNF